MLCGAGRSLSERAERFVRRVSLASKRVGGLLPFRMLYVRPSTLALLSCCNAAALDASVPPETAECTQTASEQADKLWPRVKDEHLSETIGVS